MEVSTLLSRLAGVRKNGGRGNSWVCKCPAHEDRSPSLTVTQLGDGRILMHCFAGCGTDAILAVLGLTISDLFREPLVKGESQSLKPVRAYGPQDALRCLNHEASVLLLLATELANGAKVRDLEPRLAAMVGRIHEISRFPDVR